MLWWLIGGLVYLYIGSRVGLHCIYVNNLGTGIVGVGLAVLVSLVWPLFSLAAILTLPTGEQ